MILFNKMPRRTRKSKKTKQTHLLCWLITGFAVILFLGIVLYANISFRKDLTYSMDSLNNPNIPLQNAWIEFDFGNGKKRTFTGDFTGEYPLSSVLKSAAEKGKFSIQFNNGRIEKVDNIKGSWKIYRNNEIASIALDKLTIKSGDKYLLKIAK